MKNPEIIGLRLLKILGLFIVSGYSAIYAAAPVWKVQSADQVVYLAGTIHVLREQDYPLPNAFQQAFEEVQVVAFETDISVVKSAQFSQMILQSMRLPPGVHLKQLISPVSYQKLSDACQKIGLQLSQLEVFQPTFIMLTLIAIELKKIGVSELGVDDYFHRQMQAGQAGVEKKKIYLETPKQQLELLVNMAKGQQDAYVEQSLADISQLEEMYIPLLAAWREGDELKINQLVIEDLKNRFPEIYQRLLVSRNHNWMPKIEEMLQSKPKELVLVGTAHLIGQDGLLQLLRDKGYRLTQLD